MRIIRDILVSVGALIIAIVVRHAVLPFESILTAFFSSLPVAVILSIPTIFLWRHSESRSRSSGLLLSIIAPVISLMVFLLLPELERWVSAHLFSMRIVSAIPQASRLVIFLWMGLLMTSWGWLRFCQLRPVSAGSCAGDNTV